MMRLGLWGGKALLSKGGGVATMFGWQGGIWIKMTHALTPNNVWGFWKDLKWFVWSDTFKFQEGTLQLDFIKSILM